MRDPGASAGVAGRNGIVNVLVNVPANGGLFTYCVPPELTLAARIGCIVEVPFGRQRLPGVIWAETDEAGPYTLKKIARVLDAVPALTAAQMRLAEWLSERTLTPLYLCANVFLLEKLSRQSVPYFSLIPHAASAGAESGSFAEETNQKKILSVLSLADTPLSLAELKQKLPDILLGRALTALEKSGMIQRENRLPPAAYKPKSIRMVRLTQRPEADSADVEKLSPVARVAERRFAILQALQAAPEGIPLEELRTRVTVRADDLKLLQSRGLISIDEKQVWRDYQAGLAFVYPEIEALTTEQRLALETILVEMKSAEKKKPVLICGVTGSGKTEIYLRAAAAALEMKKQVLILVPEIALTPLMVNRFERRFPGIVGLFHSKMNPGQRFDTWLRCRDGEFRIVIGARSALSVPLPDLGLIIVDECHDDSFYQQDAQPYFSASQLAVNYAAITDSQLIMGSATPSVSQMFRAEKSGWKVLKLVNRASGISRPIVLLADMRQELKAGNRSEFSSVLIKEIGLTLEMKLQTILYLNRRGSAGYSFCRTCGFDFRCPHCDIPLTFHRSNNVLACHFCGYRQLRPERCPQCGQATLSHLGVGVEQIERSIQQRFPAARVLRMDSQTTAAKGSHERILSDFEAGRADILIGTQMVAKGLDFPGVRLVGAVLADVGTNFHDYRVDELTFQLLTQVIGRAGRIDIPGIAVVQTYQPERYSIRAAMDGDYEAFYQKELSFRREMGYPPFIRLGRVLIQDKDPRAARAKAENVAGAIRAVIRESSSRSLSLIGPAPCYFQKIRGEYRWHVILRAADPAKILRVAAGQGYRIEIDPLNLL